jgi:hypothetical protein
MGSARWLAGLSDDDGGFVLDGVPVGTQILRVRQFGYEDLEPVVEVREGMGRLDLRLLPDPVELREITVVVDGTLTLTGRVVHSCRSRMRAMGAGTSRSSRRHPGDRS